MLPDPGSIPGASTITVPENNSFIVGVGPNIPDFENVFVELRHCGFAAL